MLLFVFRLHCSVERSVLLVIKNVLSVSLNKTFLSLSLFRLHCSVEWSVLLVLKNVLSVSLNKHVTICLQVTLLRGAVGSTRN